MTLQAESTVVADSAQDALPTLLSSFVGRERELKELGSLLLSSRLLTLTGAGGSGKTRLAREAASRAHDTDRIAWVDLAPLTDASLLDQHLAQSLGLGERPGSAPKDQLRQHIGTQRFRLVLDNCEHLVDACALLVESLLIACPELRVLATSREALGVAGETAWLVPSMEMGEAIQLFVDRAKGVQPSFGRTPQNSQAITEICQRLDGIPLAIELAAARVRVLTPEQISVRLADALRLLSSGSRTALPRHRTHLSDDGRHAASIETLGRAIARDMLYEAAWRALISAHLKAGERGHALRAYQKLAGLLKSELGAMPDHATTALLG